MAKKTGAKAFIAIIVFVLFSLFLAKILAEPWIRKKILSELNGKNSPFVIDIGRVHVLILSSSLELENIAISPDQRNKAGNILNGQIRSLKFRRINLPKAIFKNNIRIGEVIITKCMIRGKLPFQKAEKPMKYPLNIVIGRMIFDKIDVSVQDDSSSKSISLVDGYLTLYNINAIKNDTLSARSFEKFDLKSAEIGSVSGDSLYSFKASGVNYSADSHSLTADSFFIRPGYPYYEFTSRFKYQTDRIEAVMRNINILNIEGMDFFKSKGMVCSYIKIEDLVLNAFRDKRKEFRHVKKPTFQELIYNYPGTLRIDSLQISNGDIKYIEHTEDANEPGMIQFKKLHLSLYNINNDSVSKTINDHFMIKGSSLLMGKAKMTVQLSAKLSDDHDTFTMDGTLSGIEAEDLNPILEKGAFVYATGKIDGIKFSFTANDIKSDGRMTMLYHGLKLTIKNKSTDDTTAFKERLTSWVANFKVIDANPLPDHNIREGNIDYERDPEKFLFNYCFKSILSGIKSSVLKNPQKGI